jgi:hypothetical protein
VGAGSVSLFVPEAPARASGQWWPAELGFPNGSGGQNQVRYAYFNPARRLAVELNGHVTIYDSLDHEIGGVSQQQGSQGSLTFTSQYGTVNVSSLPIVSVDDAASDAPERRRPPASLKLGPHHAGQEIDSRTATEGHCLAGGVRRQEGRASVTVVRTCRCAKINQCN